MASSGGGEGLVTSSCDHDEELAGSRKMRNLWASRTTSNVYNTPGAPILTRQTRRTPATRL